MKSLVQNTQTIVLEYEKSAELPYGGYIELRNGILTTEGKTKEEVINSLKEQFDDFLENEGRQSKYYKGLSSEEVTFDFAYSVVALFEDFKAIKISEVANLAGINASLLRQYATGLKNPSEKQAKKIQETFQSLGKQMSEVAIVA